MQELSDFERANIRADAAEYFLALALRHVVAESKRLPQDAISSEAILIVKTAEALNSLSEGDGRQFFVKSGRDDPAGFDEETAKRFPIYEELAHRMMKFLHGDAKTLWPQSLQ